MKRILASSDTVRVYNERKFQREPNKIRKNYKSLILKISLIIVLLLLVAIVSIILIKIFVIDAKKIICSDGFFQPDDEENKSSCYPCTLSNCKICKGNKNDSICSECSSGFIPEYNDKNEIINCGLQSTQLNNEENNICGEYCLECDENTKSCSKCKSGYFIPDDSDNKLICEKCDLNNCDKCQGNKNNNECILCKDNYITKYDINNKIQYCNPKCEIGAKCKLCDLNKNECIECNSGFYLPSDDEDKLECKSCSIEHCQSCHGTKNSSICAICENNYEAVTENNIIKLCNYKEPQIENCEIGEGDKCLTCNQLELNKCASCNPSYILIDGKCILDKKTETDKAIIEEDAEEYEFVSFAAKYIINDNNKIPIIRKGKNKYIRQIKVDDVLKDPNNVDNDGNYIFENNLQKEHDVKIWLEINSDILEDLFFKIENLKSIKFNKIKNIKNIAMTSMKNMLSDCINLISVDISNLETKNIENMETMFYNCSLLKEIDLSKNNFNNLKYAMGLFAYCPSLISVNLDTSFPNLENFHYAFYKCYSIKSIDLSKMNPGKLKLINDMLGDCYSLQYVNFNNFKTDHVESMKALFYDNYLLTSVDLSQFNTKNVKDMRWMFYNCNSLLNLDLSSFNTSEVTDMIVMFYNCHSLTSINLGNNFNTAKVMNMSFMFDNCTSLIHLDLRKFNTKNVKNMQYMFRRCSSLPSVVLSSFDTSQVTKFENMFLHCSSLTSLDLSNFNFTAMEKYYVSPPMMYYCKSLKYIDITPIDFIFKDFFTGIPTSGGKIRASRKLVNNILRMGIKVLLGWDWEIIEK